MKYNNNNNNIIIIIGNKKGGNENEKGWWCMHGRVSPTHDFGVPFQFHHGFMGHVSCGMCHT